jgi:hypothetical protein
MTTTEVINACHLLKFSSSIFIIIIIIIFCVGMVRTLIMRSALLANFKYTMQYC